MLACACEKEDLIEKRRVHVHVHVPLCNKYSNMYSKYSLQAHSWYTENVSL